MASDSGCDLKVTTESVKAFCDEKDGWIVRHVYRTSEEPRRTTSFYACNGEYMARALAASLLRVEASLQDRTNRSLVTLLIGDSLPQQMAALRRWHVRSQIRFKWLMFATKVRFFFRLMRHKFGGMT